MPQTPDIKLYSLTLSWPVQALPHKSEHWGAARLIFNKFIGLLIVLQWVIFFFLLFIQDRGLQRSIQKNSDQWWQNSFHPAGDVSVVPRKVTVKIGDAENWRGCRDKNRLKQIVQCVEGKSEWKKKNSIRCQTYAKTEDHIELKLYFNSPLVTYSRNNGKYYLRYKEKSLDREKISYRDLHCFGQRSHHHDSLSHGMVIIHQILFKM